MNILCRGCGTELDLNAANCPVCLRPRDRSEMLEDAKRLREAQAAARRRPRLLLGWTLALAGGGYAAWSLRGPALAALGVARSKAGGLLEKAGDPRAYAPSPQATPAAPSGGAGRAEAPAGATEAAVPVRRAAGSPAAPAPRAPAPEPAPHDWTLPPPRLSAPARSILIRGWVYDLVKARPIPGARVSLQDRLSGRAEQVYAGSDGYYEVAVSQENSGLIPEGVTAGYRREPVEENDPPWHARKPAARDKEAAREPREVLLTFAPSQEEAVINFVLVPLNL